MRRRRAPEETDNKDNGDYGGNGFTNGGTDNGARTEAVRRASHSDARGPVGSDDPRKSTAQPRVLSSPFVLCSSVSPFVNPLSPSPSLPISRPLRCLSLRPLRCLSLPPLRCLSR